MNYALITEAMSHYASLGYTYVEVPWLVDREAIDITLPAGAKPVECLNRFLVGSAEQSFIYLIRQGLLAPGRYQAISPCFRDDPEDELHQKYFMKLELIHVGGHILKDYRQVIDDARSFYERHVDVTEKQTDEGWDIVDRKNLIELGSYGRRSHSSTGPWIYGTGVAEPRLSIVKEMQ